MVGIGCAGLIAILLIILVIISVALPDDPIEQTASRGSSTGITHPLPTSTPVQSQSQPTPAPFSPVVAAVVPQPTPLAALTDLAAAVPTTAPTPSPAATQTPTPVPVPTAMASPTPTPDPTATPLPTQTPVPKGRWETFSYRDNLTGESHTGVRLRSVWSTGAFDWVESKPAQFVLKCHHDSGLYGYFEWPGDTFWGGFLDARLPVEFVVDGVRHIGWWPPWEDKAIRVAPEDLKAFLDRVGAARVVGVRFLETEWFTNDHQARFEVEGSAWAMEQLPCTIPPLMATLSRAKQSLVRVEVHDGAGSGVVIASEQGHSLVLTAWHVVESYCDGVGRDCVGVSVVVGRKRHHGSLHAFSRDEDLAVLDVEGVLPVADLASRIPTVGTEVVTIGLPEGEHDFQYNEGRIVRHSGCSFESCLATNAKAWSGFSGGALINLDGAIVGIISEGYTGSYYSNAINVDAIRTLIRP